MKIKILLPCVLLFILGSGIVKGQIISTIAGSNAYGFSGNGNLAISAKFSEPMGTAVDNSGNVYMADRSNGVIWRIDATGIINIYAGTGGSGYSGDGGPATADGLFWP